MAGSRAVGALQRTDHLAGDAPGPALVHPPGRLVGGHGLRPRTLGGLLRKDVSGRSLISAVRRGITRSPQHLC